jgi:chromosome segregation ATPase
MPKLEATEREIPDVDGKKGRFAYLLSTAMTNYQSLTSEYEKLTQKAAEGKLTLYLHESMWNSLPKKLLEQLEPIVASKELTAVSDRVILLKVAEHIRHAALDFLYYIDKGLATGLLTVGPALERKLDECEGEKKRIAEERDRVQDNLEQVSTELISVRALYEDCERKRHIQPYRRTGSGSNTSGG